MPKYIASDGRPFTNYEANCRMNEKIMSGSEMENTRVFRKFLQHNGKEQIDKERARAQTRHKMSCLCSGCALIHKQ